MSEPRYVALGANIGSHPMWGCEDCGVVVFDSRAHTRFHSILGGHAWALAVLKSAHIASHVHDRYEVPDKIDSKRFDSWSGEAFAEVAAALPDDDPTEAST